MKKLFQRFQKKMIEIFASDSINNTNKQTQYKTNKVKRMEQQCESKVWAYELLDWINEEELRWIGLSMNPDAIHLQERNPDKINWSVLSKNPNAIYLLEKKREKVIWSLLSHNPSKEKNQLQVCVSKNENNKRREEYKMYALKAVRTMDLDGQRHR